MQTAEGRLYLHVGIDRTSKFAFTQLTDSCIQFADLPTNRSGPTARCRRRPFDQPGQTHDMEHRLTKPRQPWSNVQVERMNRTFKEATVKRFHYDHHIQLTAHLNEFINTYSYGRPLKVIRGFMAYEVIGRM